MLQYDAERYSCGGKALALRHETAANFGASAHVFVWLVIVGGLVSASARERDTQPVQFQLFLSNHVFSQYGGPEHASLAALQSKREWMHLWSQMEPHLPHEMNQTGSLPLPSIDFDRHTLIVAAAGKRPSGGFSVVIRSVAESESEVLVSVVEEQPGRNCVVTDSLTYPIALALIPRTKKRVRFESTHIEVPCE